MKTKIKFTDIAGMLERDEMSEITGGCGQTYGSAGGWGGGGGSSWASITGMGFGGGASYGGSSASSSGSSSGSSYSSNSYSSNSYSNGWSNTAGGLTTNDPKAISRYFDFVYANNGIVTNAQTNAFINNEATVAGQQANNVAYAIQLNPVTVVNNYHGPSTIPQGIVINNNGVVSSNGVILNTGGTPNTSSGGSGSLNLMNPGTPSVANAEKFFKSHFPSFKAPDGGSIKFIVGTPPPGDSLGSDGLFHGRSGAYEGLTVPDATGKNITVYLSNYAFGTDAHMHETLGHELVHVQNLIDHWDVYKSNDKLFWVNTEAAAYQFTMDSANAFGDKTIFNSAKDEYNLYSPSATQDWGHNINIPLK